MILRQYHQFVGAFLLRFSLVILAGPAAMAQEPVYFPDANLQAAVEQVLGKTGPTPTDMLQLTELDISLRGITSLAGLEYATNLTILYSHDNLINDLSPLASLTKLEILDLNFNRSPNLWPIAGLTSLTHLDMARNGITDIGAVAGLTNLIRLAIPENNITDIGPVAGLTNLTVLKLMANHIADITPIAGLTNLTHLPLDNNAITDLSPLCGLTGLNLLNVSSNPLGPEAYCVDLFLIKANNPLLTDLDYDKNQNPPDGVEASDGLYPDGVRIVWEAKCNGPNYSNEFYYRVCRGTSALPGRGVMLGVWQTGTTFDDTSALPGVIYYYWVASATDTGGADQTAYSEPDSGFLMGPTLAVSSTAGGHVLSPGEGTFCYPGSTFVQVAAAPDPNFHFLHWTGTAVEANTVADANAPETTVVVDGSYTLMANFESEMDTLYVSSSGDPNGSGTQDDPLSQVQDAIVVAAEGTRLIIGRGTYAGPLDFLGKGIELAGLDPNGPTRFSWPVIDAAREGPVVTFANSEGPDCVLKGLVLTGGEGDKAGAVYCSGSSPTILNCLIVGNRATEPDAGAVYCQDSNAVFVNCTIADNCGGSGGAGVYLVDSNVLLRNSILWGNSPAEMTVAQGPEPTVTYSNIAGGWSGIGNVAVDPLFALSGYWEGAADPNTPWIPGDYHLLSPAGHWDSATMTWVADGMTSPCIDAGDPIDDWTAEPLPNGDRVNMGAYGGTSQASLSPQ